MIARTMGAPSLPWYGAKSFTLALLAAFAACAAGCATYGYAARGPAPDYSTLPIDRMSPQESGRWSYFWGLKSSIWSPIECTETNAAGKCTRSREPCDGRGVGEVHVSLAWYTVPMAVITLGMAIPSNITTYCSTLSAPGTGP